MGRSTSRPSCACRSRSTYSPADPAASGSPATPASSRPRTGGSYRAVTTSVSVSSVVGTGRSRLRRYSAS
ncbi:Uncharacterised protein [Mycobacteroides abscessus]|nr:Uncharacterised protein [Mycobacteroides abscessus]